MCSLTVEESPWEGAAVRTSSMYVADGSSCQDTGQQDVRGVVKRRWAKGSQGVWKTHWSVKASFPFYLIFQFVSDSKLQD